MLVLIADGALLAVGAVVDAGEDVRTAGEWDALLTLISGTKPTKMNKCTRIRLCS